MATQRHTANARVAHIFEVIAHDILFIATLRPLPPPSRPIIGPLPKFEYKLICFASFDFSP